MERHALIHSPEFRLNFMKPNSRPLFKCEDPILQLESLGARKTVKVPGNETFLHEIFVATFNMLWDDDGNIAEPNVTSKPAGVPPSLFYWIKMSPFVLLSKLKPWKKRHVKSHDFPLDAFDNPAIAALIAYKWGTLGFYTWLIRFALQCVYYALVIATVFVQVYPQTHNSLMALYAVIAAMSSAFLLLEVSQMLNNWIRYLRSWLYNLVDITSFVLPLSACINQFVLGNSPNNNNTQNPRGPNSWMFSFSILIIALHLGGKYDPVSSEFAQPNFDQQNWAFHTMMICYLFFTVILMLNVLIALINIAFADGDTTWQLVWLQNRLSYIESAENMSYIIPGLRENYDIFPREIYYCLMEAKIQEYKTRWSKADGQPEADRKKETIPKKKSGKDTKEEKEEVEMTAGLFGFDDEGEYVPRLKLSNGTAHVINNSGGDYARKEAREEVILEEVVYKVEHLLAEMSEKLARMDTMESQLGLILNMMKRDQGKSNPQSANR
ncbi:hypothetical protein BGZ83_007694 [Gryganskiella cystojenkinii]|nr:hypothetical protein BGZ83_007694 [Gryganskiella cystojenkinii]